MQIVDFWESGQIVKGDPLQIVNFYETGEIVKGGPFPNCIKIGGKIAAKLRKSFRN